LKVFKLFKIAEMITTNRDRCCEKYLGEAFDSFLNPANVGTA